MAETLIIASVTAIFLLILIQKISIRFLFRNEFVAEIDYSFFTVVLKSGKKKKSFEKISPKLFPDIKRIFDFLLRNSEVDISEIKIKSPELEPKSFILRYKNLFSLFAALTVYLSKKTKKLSLSDSSLEFFAAEDCENGNLLDISIQAPLYITLTTTAMFLLLKLKNKRILKAKRRRKCLKTK